MLQMYTILCQILQEEPDYPEALIGRGTAYAFQRELHAAIADFTKVELQLVLGVGRNVESWMMEIKCGYML